jgi:hypothetical protein
MKKLLLRLLIFLSILSSCRKDDFTSTSGTVRMNNVGYFSEEFETYYVYGFLFSKAKLVSTLDTPPPDITIDNDGTLSNLILQANNFKNSFYKVGEFTDAVSAEQAFKNLSSPTVPQWVVWADSIEPNQIWLYRSGTDHYTKIRIVNTVSKDSIPKGYAECTFQWVYQPDGTSTFPGK